MYTIYKVKFQTRMVTMYVFKHVLNKTNNNS